MCYLDTVNSVTLKVLKELSFPEYRARHVFTAKLRLSIFIGFWFLYVIFLKDYLAETKSVTIIVLISFLATTICYYNIFNNKFFVWSFFLEIVSDLVSMTAIVYLTGGPESEYYIIYIFYAVAGGLFYNYRLALLLSVFSFIAYGSFLILCYFGIIPPLLIGLGNFSSVEVDSPYLYPFLLIIFLALAVYATKIAHYFTQIRERMLEARNKELLALQRMSSTIRAVASFDSVLTQVINGVQEGLGLSFCLLMLYDHESKKVRCIPPENHALLAQIEDSLGIKLRQIYFPMEAFGENAALSQVREGRIIFRRDVSEIVLGLEPAVDAKKLKAIQESLGIKRVIAIPLVTSREIIGALICFTTEAFVEAKKIQTFQAFSDQAALALEVAMLINELKKKNVALVEANRVKSEFLATMSHELRTPLTAIIGFSELLLEGVMGEISEEQKDSLKEILNNGSNLLEMINNILDLAKVESGKMELAKRTFDWGEMIQRVERSVAPLVQRKKHKLVRKISLDIPTIFADEKRMQQVVLNLLSNAIKFTPESGTITVMAKGFPSYGAFAGEHGNGMIKEQSVDVRLFDKGLILCSVEDNGIGISKDELPRIFDVFHQVDSSVTRSYEGSGLGLALVKQFVELHGGLVWVESEKDRGTKFTFIIPVT